MGREEMDYVFTEVEYRAGNVSGDSSSLGARQRILSPRMTPKHLPITDMVRDRPSRWSKDSQQSDESPITAATSVLLPDQAAPQSASEAPNVSEEEAFPFPVHPCFK